MGAMAPTLAGACTCNRTTCHHCFLTMGKNTTLRKVINSHLDKNPLLEVLLPQIKGNVGLVFTMEELCDVRDLILANKVSDRGSVGVVLHDLARKS